MNKVIQVNLSGVAFTFDDVAYAELDDYLARLDAHFAYDHGRADIMADIEGRLAELFTQGLKGRTIVGTADVRAAIATLGQPESLGADAADDEDPAAFGAGQRHGSYADARDAHRDYGYSRYGRRLMRDPDDKIVAGVCSGLSAYFGIDNPVWLRLAFATAVLGAGIGVLPYVILWIVMPVVKTPKDRLAMRGEPIDLEHISRQVEHEASAFGERVREWGDDLSQSKWAKKPWASPFTNFGHGSRNGRPARNAEEFRRRQRDEGYMV